MTMRPVSSGERIEVLDALRGAALFGIIAANMRGFTGPLAAYFDHTVMLYGRVNPLLGFVPTIAIYIAQVVLSVWWLRHFAMGPTEWLWRRLTYGPKPVLASPPMAGSV